MSDYKKTYSFLESNKNSNRQCFVTRSYLNILLTRMISSSLLLKTDLISAPNNSTKINVKLCNLIIEIERYSLKSLMLDRSCKIQYGWPSPQNSLIMGFLNFFIRIIHEIREFFSNLRMFLFFTILNFIREPRYLHLYIFKIPPLFYQFSSFSIQNFLDQRVILFALSSYFTLHW